MAAVSVDEGVSVRRKIKKRKYSRKGCKECKRRKIKCDEQLPACLNCSRLKKSCTYITEKTSKDSEGSDDFTHSGSGSLRSPENTRYTHPQALTVKFYEPKLEPTLPAGGKMGVRGLPLTRNAPLGPQIPNLLTAPHELHAQNCGPASSDTASSATGNSVHSDMSRPGSGLGQGPLDLLGVPQMDASGLSFGVSEMQDFSNNVNVFLEDMYTCQPIEGMEFAGQEMAMGYLPNPAGIGQPLGPVPGHVTAQTPNLPNPPKEEPNNSTDADEAALGLHADDFPLFHEPNVPGQTPIHAPINEHILLSNSALSEQCIEQNALREPHSYYLRLLTNTDLSFHLFPFAPSMDSNGVVKLLLTYSVKCTHLLTALLAISATFQFIRTSEKRHDVASQFYNMVCFRALSAAFTKHNYYDDSETFARSIEKLLLTVLVISTRFTATSSLQDSISNKPWKVHLKGAVDLLRRYSEMTQNSSKSGELYMSSGLALAKCWFFAIEASAAMHTALGGTLSRASEWEGGVGLDLAPDVFSHAPKVDLESEYNIFVATGCIDKKTRAEYSQALERVSLICKIGKNSVFNLYWGFNSSLVRPVLAFVACTDTVKLRRLARVPFKWTMHILGLLDSSLQEQVVPEVCLQTFRIPCASRGHPEYMGHDKLSLPESCYVSRPDRLGNRVYYSWFDASHQFHGDYLSLRVMVSHNFLGLPRSHPDVQYLLRKVFDGAFFIESKLSPQYELDRQNVLIESANYYLCTRRFDIRCVMVHSLFRLVSGIAIEPSQFERLELYFMGLLKLGNGGSLKSMDMIERVKSSREANRQRLNGAVDDEVFDFYDSMNDIPFS